MRSLQIIVILLLLVVSVWGLAKPGKKPVSVGLAITGGFRDTAWEIGNDLSLQVDTDNLEIRLRAPIYYTIAKHPRLDPYDWDQPGDYGRILDQLRVHTDNNSLVLSAGPLRNVTLGIGEIAAGYFNYLSHRSARAGFRLKADMNFLGADVVVSNIISPLDLIMADVFFRPMYSLGGVLRHFRLEAQIAGIRPVSGKEYTRYGFGLHAAVYENKNFSIGLLAFMRKEIYTFGLFSDWKARHVSGNVQAGLRVTHLQANTPLIGPFFDVDRQCLGCLGSKKTIQNKGPRWDSIGVAAGFLRFRLLVSHILDLWGLIDFDTVDTAVYAAGMGLTLGNVRAAATVAIRGRGNYMYSAEARWMFYGPLYLTVQGSQSFDYDNAQLHRVNVVMGGLGAILRW